MCVILEKFQYITIFFSFNKLPKLTGKHVVFGEIVFGMDVLDQIESAGSEGEEADGESCYSQVRKTVA